MWARARELMGSSRLFGSAVITQAVLSLGNLLLGMALIRASTEEDYGRYVLGYTLLALAIAVPNAALFGPQAILCGKLDADARRRWVSRVSQQLARGCLVGCAAVTVLMGLLPGLLLHRWEDALLGASVAVAAAVSIRREHFRAVLYLSRLPTEVLKSDAVYAAVAVALTVALATLVPGHAAPWVMLGLALAAGLGAWRAHRTIDERLGWAPDDGQNRIASLWPLGRWALLGSMINWSFVQGFYFVMVALIDVRAVAAVAATRLLLMPVNLLSTGVGQLLLPMAAGWFATLGGAVVLRRLTLIAAGLLGLTLLYTAVLWLLQGWIMGTVLGREFDDQSTLIAAWATCFAIGVVRTTIARAAMVVERFKALSGLEAITAVVSLGVGSWAMMQFGAVGGIVGLIAGEAVGLVLMAGYLGLLRRQGVLGAAPRQA
tara:strand:- start:8931 stop:10226 length:1296 start_codon:yes stop_codon:yes gene_type:complete